MDVLMAEVKSKLGAVQAQSEALLHAVTTGEDVNVGTALRNLHGSITDAYGVLAGVQDEPQGNPVADTGPAAPPPPAPEKVEAPKADDSKANA